MVDGETKRSSPDPWDIGFGVFFAGFALVCLVVWFPRDITGSVIERNAVGRVGPGDAFFPVLLASAILALSLVHLVTALVRAWWGGGASRIGRLSAEELSFLARFHLTVVVGLGVMYGLGPLAVAAINELFGTDATYRQLVDTVPYKYVGYVVGSCLLTIPIIAWAEGEVRTRSVITVLAVIAATIVLYDILLYNVQLPPNADY